MWVRFLAIFCLFFSGSILAEPCDQDENKKFVFEKNSTLRTSFEYYAKQEGWQLVWEFPGDLPLLATSTLRGEFACDTGVAYQVVKGVGSVADFGYMNISFDSVNTVIHITSSPKKLIGEG
jgi:hypothetical protein